MARTWVPGPNTSTFVLLFSVISCYSGWNDSTGLSKLSRPVAPWRTKKIENRSWRILTRQSNCTIPLGRFSAGVPLTQNSVLLNAKKRFFAFRRTLFRTNNVPLAAFKEHHAFECNQNDERQKFHRIGTSALIQKRMRKLTISFRKRKCTRQKSF
jgi:hypothetical protein